jgi:hypothetical protein
MLLSTIIFSNKRAISDLHIVGLKEQPFENLKRFFSWFHRIKKVKKNNITLNNNAISARDYKTVSTKP